MPSAVTPRRRLRDGSPEDENVRSSAAASSTAKRARLNLNGDFTHNALDPVSPNGYTSNDENVSHEQAVHSRTTKAKHQPGSIVRVELTNFVTYTAVEFRPGPSLNMVIGPNGTGKSTLVCAICLGLGWGPQHLGRAKDISEFVKHGEQEATIEIELAADPQRHRRNPLIRCNIKRENNKSTFSIDGRPSNKKAVIELCKSFTIQIDNLCQFLPQDKVVEFAAMTPIELLRSTQRAVAPPEMLDMHDELKEHRQKQKSIQAKAQADQETLANLENRHRMQADDVQRMREREVTKQRVRYLEAARPIPKYKEARDLHHATKHTRRQTANELEDLKREVEPSLRAVNGKQQYQQEVEAVTTARRKLVQEAEKTADGIERKLKTLHDRKGEFEAEIEAEKNGGKENRKEVARLEQIVVRLKKQIEEQPPDLDISGYNERIREKQRAMDDAANKVRELQRKQEDLGRSGKEKNQRIHQAKRDLDNLESQAGQQETKLGQTSNDTFKAWEWIKQHQDEFEKRVFGPPIVECSVTDLQYVDQIETLFQRSQLLTLTCQTKNDFKKLSNILHDELHLAEVNIQHMSGTLDNFPPPMERDQLGRYGLTGWALDYISGPEPVMAMLCTNVRLNSTGVGDSDTTAQQFELLQNGPIENWVTKRSSYKITRRREYGPSAMSTNVRDVRKANIWTNQPVDLTAKRDLQENIEGWQSEVAQFVKENREAQGEIEQLRATIRDNQEESRRLLTEKGQKQKLMSEFKALPTKLAQQEEKLAAAQQSLAEVRQRLAAIAEKQERLGYERAQTAVDYATSIEFLQSTHASLYEAEIAFIEAKSDLAHLVEKNTSFKNLLTAKQAEVDRLSEEVNRCYTAASQIYQAMKKTIEEGSPEFNAFIQELPQQMTSEELEAEIDSEKTRLDLQHESNDRGIIKEFENREQSIQKLKARLEQLQEELADAEDRITGVRERWEPELDRLIGMISQSFGENMQQIGCAGEVGVAKEEDFEDWAIKILVKFRESEPLTPLDSHRQSGGERAVSTIFYLMSLQSLTRSPFRVVDEINQGMDPRNERLVHRRMVGIACGDPSPSTSPDNEGQNGNGSTSFDSVTVNGNAGDKAPGSQYFLITPKLLPSLTYARGMRVLCIASGEHMPDKAEKVDFGRCVDLARGLRSTVAVRSWTFPGVVSILSGLSLDFKIKRDTVSFSSIHGRDQQRGLQAGLTNRELGYFANISIGTPKQFFSIQIDTGHSGLFIPSSNSSMCRDQPADCQITGAYNMNESSTATGLDVGFASDFADGSTNEGRFVTDVVSVAGVDLRPVRFGLVERANNLVQWLDVAGGRLGLGHDLGEGDKGILTTLVQEGIIASRAYSLWLKDIDSRSGSLLFGAIDESKFEMPLLSVPIVRPPDGNPNEALMTVQMTSMTLSGKAGKFSILPPDSVIYTLLTTGMQNCLLPKDIARAVHAAAGVLWDDSTWNVPFVPCNLSTADSTFTFGFGGNDGPAIRVPIKELVYPQEDNITFADGSPACGFAIGANDDQMAILGEKFLRSAYAVFDLENNQIALAQSKNSKDQDQK
ncbi:MAG: hypothetical protein Q9184_005149, partial [Pyrenodesmia sp. 2 TL-2023]